jgi:hypothetical protein
VVAVASVPSVVVVVASVVVLVVCTQGDPLAMPFYALATLPLIRKLSFSDLLQVWFADDASAAAALDSLKRWWDKLVNIGPKFGYYVNPIKSWLVVKEELREKAERIFNGLNLNITTSGRPLL